MITHLSLSLFHSNPKTSSLDYKSLQLLKILFGSCNIDMENKNVEEVAPGGTPTGSRWNPTKEQISMLESLYRQGIRTPSAEQIQEITRRLRAYGHIEGKNVFYWFQNHKARQRQKQKQEKMAFVNCFLHNKPPPSLLIPAPLPPCTNVVCSPYYMPHGGVGFYPPPQCPKVLLPGGACRRKPPLMDMVEKTKEIGNGCTGYAAAQQGYNSMISMENKEGGDGNEEIMMNSNNRINGHETLALFPLHPTGILEVGSSSKNYFRMTSGAEESNLSSSSDITTTSTVAVEGFGEQPFFDFFGDQAS